MKRKQKLKRKSVFNEFREKEMGNGSQLCNGSLKNQLGNHWTLKIFYKRSMGRGATNLSSLNWFGSNKICLFRKWVSSMSSWSLAFCAAIIWLGPLAHPTTLGHGSSHLISSHLCVKESFLQIFLMFSLLVCCYD